MALLTEEIQANLATLLVEEGLVSQKVLDAVKQDSESLKRPFFELLTEKHVIDA